MQTEDYILIEDLILAARVGAFEEERGVPQKVALDLRLGLDLRPAGKTGRLDDTICYFTLSRKLCEHIQAREWTLVEEVAAAVCEQVFLYDSRIKSARVQVRKFIIPEARFAGVQIERRRED